MVQTQFKELLNTLESEFFSLDIQTSNHSGLTSLSRFLQDFISLFHLCYSSSH